MVRLERVHTGQGVTVYAGSDGAKYLLRPVNRSYAGRRKPPVYYLLRGEGSAKPEYISGLFPTEEEREFSGDWKDAIGIRKLFRLRVLEAGAVAELRMVDAAGAGVHSKGGKMGVERGVRA